MKKIIILLGFIPALLMGAAFFEEGSFASMSGHHAGRDMRATNIKLSPEKSARNLNEVVAVIEGRMKDHRLSEKAVQKLVSMNSADYGLVASLCEQISKDANSAGADVALLLITALIVLP